MSSSVKKKPYAKTVVLGLLSTIAVYLLFAYQNLVTDYFIRGGIYAALPIVTAFAFSFLQGAFASDLLVVLGIGAAKAEAKKH